MSALSFQSFCVEYYAKHIGATGADVYRVFRESGLMKVLGTDYEDLTAIAFADDSIGLYGQSALNIASAVIAEREQSPA